MVAERGVPAERGDRTAWGRGRLPRRWLPRQLSRMTLRTQRRASGRMTTTVEANQVGKTRSEYLGGSSASAGPQDPTRAPTAAWTQRTSAAFAPYDRTTTRAAVESGRCPRARTSEGAEPGQARRIRVLKRDFFYMCVNNFSTDSS